VGDHAHSAAAIASSDGASFTFLTGRARSRESAVTYLPPSVCPLWGKTAEFPYPSPKISSIRNNVQYRQGMTERYFMTRPHVDVFTRLSAALRPSATLAATFLGLGLIVIGVARIVSNSQPGGAVHPGYRATLADSPTWQRLKPEWPKYMAQLPPDSPAHQSPAAAIATVVPAVVYNPPSTAAAPPAVAAGREMFGTELPQPADRPVPPQAENPPPPYVAQRPAWTVPAPTPSQPYVRTETMEKIATQADQQVRHGFELADRGAYFAARAEFTAALRLIAQGLDNDQNTTFHSQALSAAMTAMQEAQDFIPVRGRVEGDVDLRSIVAGHSTPVLKNVPDQPLQAMRALTIYHTFAQDQLARAAEHEVAGSMALGALGKMHTALAGRPNPEIVVPEAKAIVFFQAAILVCPRNYIAANDLAVLLAHSGDYAGARRLLEHSVLVCRTSENLNNLSVVYRQMGDQRLAALAADKAQAAKAAEVARQRDARLSADGSVEWVDPAALAQSPGQWADPPQRSNMPVQPGSNQPQPVIGLPPAPYGPAAVR
jgi:tetratricopeptide (TPR) repeat protein